MPFFKTTANLPANEKAKLEFHLQQLAECIGFDRLLLPVLSPSSILYEDESDRTSVRKPREILTLVGKHLGHYVSEIRIESEPQVAEKCGGGG